KRVFQALRIAVNDELGVFERSLEAAIEILNKDGRVSVITFHSLEDRICKQMFVEYEKGPELPKGLPVIPEEYRPDLKRINRKPILADGEELENNPRARSAKLRIAEKQKKDEISMAAERYRQAVPNTKPDDRSRGKSSRKAHEQ